jgi:hypothetical protein
MLEERRADGLLVTTYPVDPERWMECDRQAAAARLAW